MRKSSSKAAIIGLCLLALAGCSAVRVGYNQAPTLVWWWLDSYVDFNAEQAPRVKDALQQWFAWHRRTQLPDYAQLLASAREQAMQPLSAAQVCRWSDELLDRIDVALARALPLAAQLAPSLTAQQLGHLERRYRQSNADFQDDFLQAAAEERLQASVKRARERAEMLYGRLDDGQRDLIAAGVAASPFDAQAWFAERQAIQQETLMTLHRIAAGRATDADPGSALAGLTQVVQHLQASPRAGYRAYRRGLTAYNCELIARLHNSTTPAQRLAARARLQGWEEDLRILAAQADRAGG